MTNNHRPDTDAAGAATPVNIPGGRVVAVPGPDAGPDAYLCFGLPGPQVPVSYSINNSPLPGPKRMLGLNVSDPATQRFTTVVSDFDPRTSVSFGRSTVPTTAPVMPQTK
jgi:hypothetical protein